MPWLHGHVTSEPPPPAPVRVRTVSPYVLLVVAAGFVAAAAGQWRPGLVVAGLALAVGGILRLALPSVRLGLLVVRSRPVDALVLLAGAGVLIGVALTFPTS